MPNPQQSMNYSMYNPAPAYGYVPFNPMMNNQQRLQMMEQTYPHLAQQQNQHMSQAPMLKGRMVTGIEEAKASAIDFDGSVHVFTDISNGKIYTKQLADNGSVIFNVYTMQEPVSAQESPQPTQQISQDDLLKAAEAIAEPFKSKITQLEERINKCEEMFK